MILILFFLLIAIANADRAENLKAELEWVFPFDDYDCYKEQGGGLAGDGQLLLHGTNRKSFVRKALTLRKAKFIYEELLLIKMSNIAKIKGTDDCNGKVGTIGPCDFIYEGSFVVDLKMYWRAGILITSFNRFLTTLINFKTVVTLDNAVTMKPFDISLESFLYDPEEGQFKFADLPALIHPTGTRIAKAEFREVMLKRLVDELVKEKIPISEADLQLLKVMKLDYLLDNKSITKPPENKGASFDQGIWLIPSHYGLILKSKKEEKGTKLTIKYKYGVLKRGRDITHEGKVYKTGEKIRNAELTVSLGGEVKRTMKLEVEKTVHSFYLCTKTKGKFTVCGYLSPSKLVEGKEWEFEIDSGMRIDFDFMEGKSTNKDVTMNMLEVYINISPEDEPGIIGNGLAIAAPMDQDSTELNIFACETEEGDYNLYKSTKTIEFLREIKKGEGALLFSDRYKMFQIIPSLAVEEHKLCRPDQYTRIFFFVISKYYFLIPIDGNVEEKKKAELFFLYKFDKVDNLFPDLCENQERENNVVELWDKNLWYDGKIIEFPYYISMRLSQKSDVSPSFCVGGNGKTGYTMKFVPPKGKSQKFAWNFNFHYKTTSSKFHPVSYVDFFEEEPEPVKFHFAKFNCTEDWLKKLYVSVSKVPKLDEYDVTVVYRDYSNYRIHSPAIKGSKLRLKFAPKKILLPGKYKYFDDFSKEIELGQDNSKVLYISPTEVIYLIPQEDFLDCMTQIVEIPNSKDAFKVECTKKRFFSFHQDLDWKDVSLGYRKIYQDYETIRLWDLGHFRIL